MHVTTAEMEQGECEPGSPAATFGAPVPGDLLDGHYRLGEELGRGGMGVVFQAENVRTGQAVAIKYLTSREGLPEGRVSVPAERMRREARAIAKICHPHVVHLYDLGGTDCAPFLVMELLKGETLQTRLARGRFGWDEALALILPVIDAVHAAHKVGIVHRDLKPDNIFLCSGEAAQRAIPKVLDFGVASWSGGATDELTKITRAGSMLGTPAYMALEQLTSGTIDRRTDVYALAAVLYQMLTAELPFDARCSGELAILQATTLPRKPSLFNSELSGERESTLLKALSRSPEARFDDAAAFARALKSARPERRLARLRAPLIGAAALSLVAIIAFQYRDSSDVSQATSAEPVLREELPSEAQQTQSDAVQTSEPWHAEAPPRPAVLGSVDGPTSDGTPRSRPKRVTREQDGAAPKGPSKPVESRTHVQIELEDFYERGQGTAKQ